MDALTEINNDMRFEHFIDESLDIDMSACAPIHSTGANSYFDEILSTATAPTMLLPPPVMDPHHLQHQQQHHPNPPATSPSATAAAAASMTLQQRMSRLSPTNIYLRTSAAAAIQRQQISPIVSDRPRPSPTALTSSQTLRLFGLLEQQQQQQQQQPQQQHNASTTMTTTTPTTPLATIAAAQQQSSRQAAAAAAAAHSQHLAAASAQLQQLPAAIKSEYPSLSIDNCMMSIVDDVRTVFVEPPIKLLQAESPVSKPPQATAATVAAAKRKAARSALANSKALALDGEPAPKKPAVVEFFCHQCDVRFKSHVEFEMHYRDTHATTPPTYACALCPKKLFGNLQSYRTHAKRHSERHPCAVCTRKFLTAEQLAEHGRTHTSELRLQCGHCQQQFDDFGEYCQHVRVHRRPVAAKPVKWKCPDCGKLFKNRAGLNNHAKVHRETTTSATTATAPIAVSHIETAASVDFRSIASNANVSISSPTVANQAAHAIAKPMSSNKPMKTSTPKSTQVVNQMQPTATARPTVIRPTATVPTQQQPQPTAVAVDQPPPSSALPPPPPVRPFVCEVCDKSFPGRTQLLRHRDHHNERSFKCQTCEKFYKTERDLKVHSLVHYEQRPHACTHCGKTFLSSSKLKQHSNVHTGERPFKCKYCDKDFTNFPNWLKHVRRSHKVDHKTGEQLETLPNFLVREKKSAATLRAKKELAAAAAAAASAVAAANVTAATGDDAAPGMTAKTTKATAAAAARKAKVQVQKEQQQQLKAAAAAVVVRTQPAQQRPPPSFLSPAASTLSPSLTPSLSSTQIRTLHSIKQEFIVPADSTLDLHDSNATAATSTSVVYQDEASLPLDLRDLSASIQLQQSIDVHDVHQMQMLIPSHDESFASIEDVPSSSSPAAAAEHHQRKTSPTGGAKTAAGRGTMLTTSRGASGAAESPLAVPLLVTPTKIKQEPGRFSILALLSQSSGNNANAVNGAASAATTTTTLSTSPQSSAASAAAAAGTTAASVKKPQQLSPLSSSSSRRHFGGVATSHHMFATNVL